MLCMRDSQLVAPQMNSQNTTLRLCCYSAHVHEAASLILLKTIYHTQ